MKKILLTVCALLLSVTVSVAWILTAQEQKTYSLLLDYSGIYENNKLTVVNMEDIRLTVYSVAADGTRTRVDENRPLRLDGMVPGQSLRFALQIENVGEGRAMKLMLSDILCESRLPEDGQDPQDLFRYMCVCASGGEKYRMSNDPNYTVPDTVFASLEYLREPSFQAFTSTLYPALWVPYTGEGEYVDLECRFWLDSQAEGVENMTLTVSHFVMST